MKFVLFPLVDATGEPCALGVVCEGEALEPIALEDMTVADMAREVSKSIRTQYPGALVTFTDQPDAHPDVARVLSAAVARAMDDGKPTAAEPINICETCTHSSVCAIAVAASLLANLNPRVAGCDAHTTKERDDD